VPNMLLILGDHDLPLQHSLTDLAVIITIHAYLIYQIPIGASKALSFGT
jgi:hypothetical protein